MFRRGLSNGHIKISIYNWWYYKYIHISCREHDNVGTTLVPTDARHTAAYLALSWHQDQRYKWMRDILRDLRNIGYNSTNWFQPKNKIGTAIRWTQPK